MTQVRAARRAVPIAWLLGAALAGCRAEEASVPSPPPAQAKPTASDDPWEVSSAGSGRGGRRRPLDYAKAREGFRTRLIRTAGSPQPGGSTDVRGHAVEIELESAGRKLRAWRSPFAAHGAPRAPAVLYLHGGFAFGAEDWEEAGPFRDAGFVVMVPILRGENGTPGAFTLFYDEVDDVLAAASVLADQPDVDPRRVYVSGHSAGGVLTMLAAMTSRTFRAAAPLAGAPDARVFADSDELIPFDRAEPREFVMRSPIAFPASFKCPARLYVGADEELFVADTQRTARIAKIAGVDVEAVVVPGDHMTMKAAAIPLAIAFFRQQR